MERTIILSDGSKWAYYYGIRAFLAFEVATGRTDTGESLTDNVMMFGCTLYDKAKGNPSLEQIMQTIDEEPQKFREWLSWFTQDAEEWGRAYEGEEEGEGGAKKKESAIANSTADS